MAQEDLKALATSLTASLDDAKWSWIKPHAERDVVIVVTPTLHLVDVAVQIASNQTAQVQTWIEEKKLGKPTAEQLAAWNLEPEKSFKTLVVQPFVLIQEPLVH